MQGYYRFPSIYKDQLIFISEDNIWTINLNDHTARRLTNNIGPIISPRLSPNGKWIAYVGTEDGNTEIYVMPSSGGISKRLTFDGAFISKVATWKGDDIIYTSDLGQHCMRICDLRSVNLKGGESHPLNFGIASNISYSKYGTVLGRNTQDPARWKRYKGGTAGELWIDKNNSNDYKKLINLNGNMACPMYIENRIYFLSDHDGIANIYSCFSTGKSLKKHTFHKNYYARNATTDGQSIVYHCGSDIYHLDISTDNNKKIEIIYNSGFENKTRKFSLTSNYLESFSLNNEGNYINIISRGKPFTMGNWSGPVYQHGKLQGVRYKHIETLTDDNKVIVCTDEGNKERLEVYNLNSKRLSKRLNVNIGRPISMKKSPTDDKIVIVNHKHELHLIDINKDSIKKLDHSPFLPLSCNWSSDGNFITYNCSKTPRVSIIKIYDIKSNKKYEVTEGVSSDFSPFFDPSGNFLVFLSNRTFNPVYDSIQFDLNFTKSEKPYLIALNKNVESPFMKNPNTKSIKDDKKDKKKDSKDKKIKNIKIDFKGIKDRIIGIPIKETLLGNSVGFNDNKIFYTEWPVEGSRGVSWSDSDNIAKGTLKYFDLNTLKENVYMQNVSGFIIDNKSNNILVYDHKSLRILSPKTIPNKEILSKNEYTKETGLINLDRIKLDIEVTSEWKQMYSEAWRLQRDFFWVSNMSGINWKLIHERYYHLVDRVGSRSEFSDLVWEMQGELGTSHCYEFGGDYKQRRNYNVGLLGCDLRYDNNVKAYKIISRAKGDIWEVNQSPLLRPSLNINVGEYIKEVNNVKLSKKITIGELLVNQANKEVELTILNKAGKKPRKVTIKTLSNTYMLHYRDWVEKNRDYVHKKTKGKVGYLHIPDMGAAGFGEFHRYFLAEIVYDGLIVDVRFNGGGHVSQLLLSKLAKKRLGFDITRWMGVEPFPSESPGGPMVAVTNEYAGSDGDIFSHSWKLMNLGKLIGRRTWGGVIGIWPRNSLVDGTLTSQPEFSFWFKDVGFNVENYGTDVDIEVHITPKDHQNDVDTQLNKAIDVILKDLKKKGAVLRTDFGNKPDLKLP